MTATLIKTKNFTLIGYRPKGNKNMSGTVADLNNRSIEVFREIIDAFIETGEPVGSRTLSRRLKSPLSPATIRNVMADLEDAGLLYAPHTSAGRLPTDAGLRFFVNGLLEVGDIQKTERDEIERRCKASGLNLDSVLNEASTMLSGLSSCAGLVMAPKTEATLKHLEFVYLSPGRTLAVLITNEGTIENRVLDLPDTITQSVLNEAARYLTARIHGRTLAEARHIITQELTQALDNKDTLTQLLDASIQAEGVQIFIGAENSLFRLSGCSLVVSPYRNTEQKIIGAIGVIGPSRMNYSRIIPLVDYTARIIGKLVS